MQLDESSIGTEHDASSICAGQCHGVGADSAVARLEAPPRVKRLLTPTAEKALVYEAIGRTRMHR